VNRTPARVAAAAVADRVRQCSRAVVVALLLALLFVSCCLGPVLAGRRRPRWVAWRATLQVRVARWMLAVLGVRREVTGPAPVGPCLFVSNHLGYLDVAVLGSLFPAVFVAKSEVARWAVIGPLCRASGTIFVDRDRRVDVRHARADIDAALRDGQVVVVFAESVATPGHTVLPFHASLLDAAVRLELPLAYATLRYSIRGDAAAASRAVSFWGSMKFIAHLWALLRVRSLTATVTFGPRPLAPAPRRLLAAESHAAVLAQLVPMVADAPPRWWVEVGARLAGNTRQPRPAPTTT
jgi:1-acyl-sn-glycerol-3-phosphate acyltransferase